LSVCYCCRPMREKRLATWDGGKVTWGGRVRVYGTVPVYVCVHKKGWGLSSAVYFELQGYMTYTWVQDQRIDAKDTLIATLTTQLSSLQGHLATALGEIRALQDREQARAGVPEGAGSST
nr:hypothetical protein [Tanacetum cinerariifolium]GFA36999.1 hypothetical protein [Tanacetum cinerariifolium]